MAQGIKETKEAAIGAITLGFHLTRLMKDGFQIQDLAQFMDDLKNDQDFAQKLKDAYEGMQAIPEEMKEIDLAEGLELAMAIVPAVMKELAK